MSTKEKPPTPPEKLSVCFGCDAGYCILGGKEDAILFCHKDHPGDVVTYHREGSTAASRASEADDTITLKVSDLLKIIRGVTP